MRVPAMNKHTAVWGSLVLLLRGATAYTRDARSAVDTCTQISHAISNASALYWPGAPSYISDTEHWMSSSSQVSACSVEPGTASDVGTILKIVGNTSTPFAVMGGGHASNPGFSSTPGVQIAMTRFNEVTYSPDSQTVIIGSGLVWDDVYSALEDYNVNVVGGRVSGVGVAGFTLGGGYSWKTSQHGLTEDNVVAYELVLPNGTVTTVTDQSSPDLMFGLKGGFNNFGIVTRFTMKAYPQTQVWGGALIMGPTSLDPLSAATAKFQQTNTDPKAEVLTTYNSAAGVPGAIGFLFYDAPTPPAGIFEDFLAIPVIVNEVKTQSFSDLVGAQPTSLASGFRGCFHSMVTTTLTKSFLDAVVNETEYWGSHLTVDSGLLISYDVEPFVASLLTHNTGPTAWPPDRSRALLPVNLYYSWLSPTSDEAFYSAIRESAAYLISVAEAEGESVQGSAIYPNYAVYDEPLEGMYGSNVDRLKAIKNAVDPGNVMGLAGGFKF